MTYFKVLRCVNGNWEPYNVGGEFDDLEDAQGAARRRRNASGQPQKITKVTVTEEDVETI